MLVKTDVFLLPGRDDFATSVERRAKLWSLEVREANILSILDLIFSTIDILDQLILFLEVVLCTIRVLAASLASTY